MIVKRKGTPLREDAFGLGKMRKADGSGACMGIGYS
jgi:hypothetical protein